MPPDFVRRDTLGCSNPEFMRGIRFKPAGALAAVTTVIRDSRQRSYVGAAQRPSLELKMSDTANACRRGKASSTRARRRSKNPGETVFGGDIILDKPNLNPYV